MLMIARRQILSYGITLTGASFVLSPSVLLPQESREHLELMMTHSSYVDEKAIDHLAAITQKYWDLRETTAAIDLLSGIKGHFITITQLLKESRPTRIYKKLGALASETAQLLGRTFDEMREYDLAWNCYAFALNMAQDIHHDDLWAAGAVRLAELIWGWRNPLDALPFLEEAQKRGIRDQRLGVWLSATEARIYAMTGSMDVFLRASDRSKKITLPESLSGDIYRTDFNPSEVARRESDCFMDLCQPERALPTMKEALATCDPTSTRYRSVLLANVGRVYGQLGDVKTACKLLLESLDITTQVKSLVTLRRIYKGRSELDSWKDSGDVKELDERIVEVHRSLAKVKERV
jgi:tetratricopeptide (TPR) repeat protein